VTVKRASEKSTVRPVVSPAPQRRLQRADGVKGGRKRVALVAGALAGLILAAASLPASGGVLAVYYSPRLLAFYPLVVAFFLLWLVVEPLGRDGLRLDSLDIALLAFALWQLVAAAAAPVATLAWFGAYNRVGGAVYWVALALIVFVCRRLVTGGTALVVFVWVVSSVVIVATCVAALQAAGLGTPWPYQDIWLGRVSGTTGNPVNLAGLCLVAVWLALLAAASTLPRSSRAVAGIAAAMAAGGIVLAVSRAAYVAVALATLLVVAAAIRGRRRRIAAAALAVAAVLAAAALLYHPGPSGAGSLAARVSLDPASQTYGLVSADDSRGTFWRVGLAALEARPLLGYGPGAYLVAYRRYVPAATMQAQPLSAVTDPHSLPLLVADGSGLPGLVLGLLCLVLVVASALPRLRGELGARHSPGSEGGEGSALAALACLAALLCLLAVSPGDPTALVPLALIAGLAAGAPRAGGRFAITVPARPALRWACRILAVATLAALAGALILGVQIVRADHAAKRGALGSDRVAAADAAALAPWVSTYSLIAWDADVRAAVAAGNDRRLAAAGAPAVERGLRYDPSDPMLRVAAVRYALMSGNLDRAARQLQIGLHFSPTNPLVEGLAGYVGQALADVPEGGTRGLALTEQLSRVAEKPADGWYWLSSALDAYGRHGAAGAALAEAHRLAPAFTPADYLARLRGQF